MLICDEVVFEDLENLQKLKWIDRWRSEKEPAENPQSEDEDRPTATRDQSSERMRNGSCGGEVVREGRTIMKLSRACFRRGVQKQGTWSMKVKMRPIQETNRRRWKK
jgi:hypothetical protein